MTGDVNRTRKVVTGFDPEKRSESRPNQATPSSEQDGPGSLGIDTSCPAARYAPVSPFPKCGPEQPIRPVTGDDTACSSVSGHEAPSTPGSSHHIIEAVVSSLQQDVYNDNGVQIENAIFSYVRDVVTRVGILQPRLKALDIVKQGSYYDGTKLHCPDEFDYAVVLQELSQPGRVEAQQGQESPGDFVIWKRCGTDVTGPSLEEISPRDIREEYTQLMFDVIFRHADTPTTKGLVKEILVELGLPTVDGVKFQLLFAEKRNPSILIGFAFKDMVICVDISLVIRYKPVDRYLVKKTALEKYIAEYGSVLLIAFNDAFNVTFSDLEREMVHNKIQERHRKLIVYLKYVNECVLSSVHNGELYVRMTPFIIKTCVLNHDITCSAASFDLCLQDIISMLETSLDVSIDLVHLTRTVTSMRFSDVVPRDVTTSNVAQNDGSINDGTPWDIKAKPPNKPQCGASFKLGFLPCTFDRVVNVYLDLVQRKSTLMADFRKTFLLVLKEVHEGIGTWSSMDALVQEIKHVAGQEAVDIALW